MINAEREEVKIDRVGNLLRYLNIEERVYDKEIHKFVLYFGFSLAQRLRDRIYVVYTEDKSIREE